MEKKKLAYIVATVVLMLGVSFIVHAVLATWVLGYHHPVRTTNPFHLLPIEAWYSVIALGLVLGFVVGDYRRDIVYVQKRHRCFKWKKHSKKK